MIFLLIADFGGAMTVSGSNNSWGGLLINSNVTEGLLSEYTNIFSIYHKIELSGSMPIEGKKLLINGIK